MAKISPFHTNSHEYQAHHREVYHDIDNCPDGKRIKPEHRVEGTGGRKRCLECEKLEHVHHHHPEHPRRHHDRPPQPDRRHA